MNGIITAKMPGTACDGPGLFTTWIRGDDMGMVIPVKCCNKCHETKRVSAFYASKRHLDGVMHTCKECLRLVQRAYYLDHRQAIIEKVAAWEAANPERANALKRTSARRKPRPYDAKERAWTQDWANRHPEETRAYARNWARAHPESSRFHAARRRARIRGADGSHTLAEWLSLCERYGRRCLACDARDVLLTQDHVVPLSQGGSDWVENIQPLCSPCNKRKGARVIDYRTVPA